MNPVRIRPPWSRRARASLGLVILLAAVGLAIWRAPDLEPVADAFAAVSWPWIFAAIGANVLSVVLRAAAWAIVLAEALPQPAPKRGVVFSSFSIGVLANALLPGRVGEVARAGVLLGHLQHPHGKLATVFGSVVTHHMLDVIPSAALVSFVLLTAELPGWALPPAGIVVGGGGALLLAGFAIAWRRRRHAADESQGLHGLFELAVRGLGVFQAPRALLAATLYQSTGWLMEFLGIWFAFRAFDVDAPLVAAGVVLLVTNISTLFPFWPGNVGLFQAAVALPLIAYGVSYVHGLGFGVGLQTIEAFVALGLGFLALVREGISFARFKEISASTSRDFLRGRKHVAG